MVKERKGTERVGERRAREAIYSQETMCAVDGGSTDASAKGQETQQGRTQERERRKDNTH